MSRSKSRADRALTRRLRRQALRRSGSGTHGVVSPRTERRTSKQALRQEIDR